jgi:hypothetical protein
LKAKKTLMSKFEDDKELEIQELKLTIKVLQPCNPYFENVKYLYCKIIKQYKNGKSFSSI